MKRCHSFFHYLFIAIVLGACSNGKPLPSPTIQPTSAQPTETAISTQEFATATLANIPLLQGTDGYPWWNDTVFYEIFVRSFYDSNNDGIGDLQGLIDKLGYLEDLGITGIFLMPIFPASDSSGYIVTNYDSVNPDYGTLADFRLLLSEAHSRGIRVIIDFPLNGTSLEHPWFPASQDTTSPYRSWYVWSQADPGYRGAWDQQVWWQSESGYYYSALDERIAELDYTNPSVTSAIEEAFQFWIGEGVDGFRLDAIKHLIEEGQSQVNTNSTHAWLKQFRLFIKDVSPDVLLVGEVWEIDPAVLTTYTQGDELDIAFNFGISASIIESARTGQSSEIADTLQQDAESFPQQQVGPFITNHDMDRIIIQLDNDTRKAKVAASILLTSPGVPFIYFGEEIGMWGEKPAGYRQACVPMQWSLDQFAGFSTTEAWAADWCPPAPTSRLRNVLSETDDPDSLLSHYRALITLRNEQSALRVGALSVITSDNPGILAVLRVSSGEAVLVIIKLTDMPSGGFHLSLTSSGLAQGQYAVLPLLGEGVFTDLPVDAEGGFSDYEHTMAIPAYSTFILELTHK